MPGFFESLSRMLKGEPLFQDSDGNHSSSTQPSLDNPPKSPKSDRTDGKIAPMVTISKIECDIDDVYMTMHAEVTNHHTERVFVDKVIILGARRELDRDLKPGEEYDFLLYKGPRPTGTQQTRAELHYRDVSGDYFASIHYLEFKKLQDGLFVVDDVRFIPPVKDI